MQTPEWARIWDVFEGALPLPAAERDSYLEVSCAADKALRREVESLLASHEEAGAFIEKTVTDAASLLLENRAAAEAAGEPAPGARIGPWEIVREIGRGGMGTVYLAERADGHFRQSAAIKILRSGLYGDEPLRRFLSERQILASLDHPNIARLLDGGATDDGVPYVAMEHVEGEPIDAFCARLGAGVADRLRLFRSVCDAVQYAHRRLVVHRDIKPGNILVTPEGVPKLLDFGIAKLLDEGSADARETRAGLRALTPAYASPEQIEGGAITTASDVYALGVLLFEILTGRLPYRLATAAPGEIERAITESEPERPSAVAPGEIRRSLAGDLDNIVLTALRKEPERRYASVDHLSEDIGRHLEGLPVQAHPPSLAYRAGKLVRRHPWGVAAATAFVVLLVGFSAVVTVQSARLASERDRARAAEALARTEAATAERTSAFLVDLFKVADPGESRGRDVTAREILDRGALRIGAELEDQPGVRARLQQTLSDVYANLGSFDEARRHAEEALALSRGLHGPEHPDVARSLAALGSLSTTQGDHAAAEVHLLAALEMRRRLLGPAHTDIADSLVRLGSLRVTEGRLEEAEGIFREALSMSREVIGPRDPKTATVLASLGWTLDQRGRFEEAESVLRESLSIREESLGEDHPEVGLSLGSLGDTLVHQGRYDEAEPVQRRYLELTRRAYGGDHHRTATACTSLSGVLKEQGDLAEAEALAREALAIYRASFGEEHAEVAVALNNIANLRQDQGDIDGAIALHRRSMEIARAIFGNEHPRLGDSLNNYANALWDRGDFDAAEAAYREALAIDRRVLGADHPYVAMDLNNLALVLRDRGDLAGAEPLVKEAIAIISKSEGEEGATMGMYIGSLGLLYSRMGRHDEAERLLRESVRILESRLSADHWRTQQARGILAEGLAARGDLAEAEALIVPVVAALTGTLGERSGYTRRAREAAVAIYEKMGRPDRAAAYRTSE